MLQIDIWSDIVCPFCYIGKRRLEVALAQFEHCDQVHIEWHSYQLDPEVESHTGETIYEYLARRKGITDEQSEQMHEHVTSMAASVGLDYRFDIAKVANSFDAHRLIHFSKRSNLADDMEEALFHAYFSEGEDIAKHATLVKLASGVGLDAAEANEVLNSEKFAAEVRRDIDVASQLGIGGVPFFVFGLQYAVSGAQSPHVFESALARAWETLAPK